MTFALQRGERIDVGARRLAREGAELVLTAMRGRDSDVAVHEARRTIKRLRALVRLIGPSIGDQADEANQLLRAAGRDFASSRDAAVMVATFDDLAGSGAHEHPVRKTLHRAQRFAVREDADAAAKIRSFASTIEAWTFDGGWSSIEPGMRRTYRAGSRALAQAIAGTTELHELRKRGKDLQFQLTLIRVAWPEVLGGYLEALRKLGARLGDEHDLAMLGVALEKQKKKHPDVEGWLSLIDERRASLRRKILPLARRIYVDKPRTWTGRLGVWWGT